MSQTSIPIYVNPYAPVYQHVSKQPNYPQKVKGDSEDAFGCNQAMIKFTIIGIALTAIAAVAAYFCIVNGLKLWDVARTSLDRFGAGFLLYSGAAFSLVAAGNIFWTGGRILCLGEQEEFKYSNFDARKQIGISIVAPIGVLLAIPACLICGGR